MPNSSQFTEDKKIRFEKESTENDLGKKGGNEFYNQYDGEKIGLKVSSANDKEVEFEFEEDSPEKDNVTNI
jgi:hypothetical protein